MNQSVDHRESARRQHRSIALFCSLKCRHFDWDGIHVSGSEIAGILGLEQFKPQRIEWIEEDFAEHFPFQFIQCANGSSLPNLTLGLRPMENGIDLRIGYLSFRKDPFDFVETINQTCLSPFVKQNRNRSELAIVALLGLLGNGQVGLNDVFGSTQGSLLKCQTLLDVRHKVPQHMNSRFH
jgi:hypothetical protein